MQHKPLGTELEDIAISPPTRCCMCSFSRRQLITMAVISFATLATSFSISLFPPFYPRLAEEKGATAAVYGFVLGSNCLTAFLVTPIIGKNLDHIGPRFAFVSGMLINGVCCILAGFLEKMPPGVGFISISIAIRVVTAFGNAGVITSSFSFIAHDFPNSVGRMFSLTRIMMNVGQLAGPALGGALYEVGGFILPFVVLGSLQSTVAIISVFFLPTISSQKDESSDDRNSKEVTILNILKIPTVWIPFNVFIVSTMANGFLSVTLEPQILRQFTLNQFVMGLVFGLKDGANSLSSPFWGWLCDQKNRVKTVLIVCCFIMCASYFLLGPFPGVPIIMTMWLLCLTLVLNGIGVGGLQLAGVIDALQEVINAGYPDDPATHGCVAGMWSSLSGFGRFLARTGSGILVDHIGFRSSITVIVALFGSVMVATAVYVIVQNLKMRKKADERKEHLYQSFSTTLKKSYEFQKSQNLVDVL